MNTPINERDLIAACKKQDRRAQEQLYRKYAAKMLAIAKRYAYTVAEAEDILQEGFVKVFTKIDQYNPDNSFEGWLRKIIVNTAINNYRKEKSHHNHSSIDNPAFAHPGHSNIYEKINSDYLIDCLSQLPKTHYAPFILHVLEGYSHQEIAQRLKISEGQSKTNVCRARISLKKILAAFGQVTVNVC